MSKLSKMLGVLLCVLLLGGCSTDVAQEPTPTNKYESATLMQNAADGIWMNGSTGAYVVVENGLLISYDENNIENQLNKLLNTALSFDDYCKTFITDCATKVDYDYANGYLLNSDTQALVLRLYSETSAFDPNNATYIKDSRYEDQLEKALLEGYISTRYSNILSNKDVQYDKFGTLGQNFMIEGTAKLDDYYNWGYRNYEASHFCINIRPVGGSYSDEWTIYASRSDYKELYNNLMNGSQHLYLIAKTEFSDTGINNMATLVDYIG